MLEVVKCCFLQTPFWVKRLNVLKHRRRWVFWVTHFLFISVSSRLLLLLLMQLIMYVFVTIMESQSVFVSTVFLFCNFSLQLVNKKLKCLCLSVTQQYVNYTFYHFYSVIQTLLNQNPVFITEHPLQHMLQSWQGSDESAWPSISLNRNATPIPVTSSLEAPCLLLTVQTTVSILFSMHWMHTQLASVITAKM